ncbi:MAG: gliding motility-associated C-terminal domain-containing protein [Saprospiraceae bacterium]|nr:gliding motility-associated C-terminal domain-containing protein [Saprospiraceae bacterium]
MLIRIIPLLMMLLAVEAMAQTPMPILLDKTNHYLGAEKVMACADQQAGTITFNNFVGQSNDIDLDTIYFCKDDQISITHNLGTANTTGDPNPLTGAGVTYAFLDCRPTISGPDLASILTDPCILNNPAPINDLWVTGSSGGAQSNGNITFFNSGSLQNTFNMGNPVLIWFAPITIDNFLQNTYESTPGGPVGPCVNMNVNEAFAVVYLNEITTAALNTNSGLSGCQGSFQVRGGLPQFNGSNYTIDISLIGNSSIKGTILSASATHGSTVVFKVPVPGVYAINIEDGKSCAAQTLFANMSSCTSVSQSVSQASATPGDQVCLDVTNEDGFTDLVAMQYALTWDESVLQYTGVQNLSPLLPSFNVNTSFNSLGDTLIFSWGNLSGTGVDVPDGTVLYQICFNVVGTNGDCTDVQYVVPEGSTIEVVNDLGSQLGFNGIDGNVCVSNSALSFNFATTPVACPSGTNGSFTLTVNNGTAPYQVAWQKLPGGPVNGPGTINLNGGSFTANNLSAGTYSVTVTDSDNPPLVKTEQVNIAGPPPLNITFSSLQPLCNGDANGSLTANLISGSTPVSNPLNNYSFAWSIPGAGNVQSVGNLPSGNYSVTVTNNNNPSCTVTASTFLDEPTPLVVNLNNTPAACTGIGNGTISVTVSGGTPNALQDYTITFPSISGGFTVVNTSASINGLETGTYPLVVTDNNGCKIEQNVFLPAIKVLDFNVDYTPIGCTNACSGKVLVVAYTTGGTPTTNFNFDWFGAPVPPPPTVETANSSLMENLCAGTLDLTIETPDGCVLDTTFIMQGASDLDVQLVNVKNESCVPGNDGQIVVTTVGGTPQYTYTWSSNAATGNSGTATGLSAGAYSVTVADSGGCKDSLLAINVVAPLPPNITALPDDMVDCANSTDGSLTVTATQGSTPIVSYTWSNGLTGATINNLPPGDYSVTVLDAGGCSAIDMAQVLASSQLVIDSFQTDPPNCPGLDGGEIIAFVSGGATPYHFDWSNNVSGIGLNLNSDLFAGTYSVTITDANDCAAVVGTVSLNDPPSILASFSAIDSVSCSNVGQTCDGAATATANYSDGTTGQFNFIWVSGETTSNAALSSASQLCAGDQRLIVSDGVCNDTFFVNIPAPPPIMPGQEIENVSCFGLSDGQITLEPTGGSPPYNIVWVNGTVGPTLSNLPVGNYAAAITDSKNCSFTHNVGIVQPPLFEVFLDPTQTNNLSCPGVPDGSISVVTQGGNLGDLVYLWENTVAGTTEPTATSLASGTYSVTVVDPKGCADSLTHTLSEPSPILFQLGATGAIQCFGEATSITVETVTGGNPTATYVFSSGACVQLPLGQPCPVLAGEHTIEILDVFNGCTVDTTISVAEPPEISVTLPALVEIELGDSLTMLDPTIVSAFPIDSFIWDPATNLSCNDCKNPRVTGIEPQTYTLTIIDVNGCTATASVFVDIDRNRNVYIPNVFSPNGDGINDKFQVFTGIGVTAINYIRIYDRWGDLVFDAKDVEPSVDGTIGWDGELRGQRMDPAPFVYLIEVEFVDKKKLLYKGDFVLLK